jgi:lipid II:glycine glycyltransferase (peptidoglycan interpeptide bridge formation enzyme)
VRMGGKPDEFIRLYRLTMLRKKAVGRWYFTDEYLRAICNIGIIGYAYVNDVIVSAALMLWTVDGTAYYHLAANADAYPRVAANDLLIDEVARYATRNCCKRFHLGGGATSDPSDPVMFFKSGFSDLRAPAMSYFRVFDEQTYAELCIEKKRREVAETGTEFGTSFEPLYRREAS